MEEDLHLGYFNRRHKAAFLTFDYMQDIYSRFHCSFRNDFHSSPFDFSHYSYREEKGSGILDSIKKIGSNLLSKKEAQDLKFLQISYRLNLLEPERINAQDYPTISELSLENARIALPFSDTHTLFEVYDFVHKRNTALKEMSIIEDSNRIISNEVSTILDSRPPISNEYALLVNNLFGRTNRISKKDGKAALSKTRDMLKSYLELKMMRSSLPNSGVISHIDAAKDLIEQDLQNIREYGRVGKSIASTFRPLLEQKMLEELELGLKEKLDSPLISRL